MGDGRNGARRRVIERERERKGEMYRQSCSLIAVRQVGKLTRLVRTKVRRPSLAVSVFSASIIVNKIYNTPNALRTIDLLQIWNGCFTPFIFLSISHILLPFSFIINSIFSCFFILHRSYLYCEAGFYEEEIKNMETLAFFKYSILYFLTFSSLALTLSDIDPFFFSSRRNYTPV